MLTVASLATWHALEDHIALHGQVPTYAELGATLGIRRESALARIRTLSRAGIVERTSNAPRAMRVLVPSGRSHQAHARRDTEAT